MPVGTGSINRAARTSKKAAEVKKEEVKAVVAEEAAEVKETVDAKAEKDCSQETGGEKRCTEERNCKEDCCKRNGSGKDRTGKSSGIESLRERNRIRSG